MIWAYTWIVSWKFLRSTLASSYSLLGCPLSPLHPPCLADNVFLLGRPACPQLLSFLWSIYSKLKSFWVFQASWWGVILGTFIFKKKREFTSFSPFFPVLCECAVCVLCACVCCALFSIPTIPFFMWRCCVLCEYNYCAVCAVCVENP